MILAALATSGAFAIVASAEDGLCGPFGDDSTEAITSCREAGVAASSNPLVGTAGFTTIAAAPVGDRSLSIPGEALLALPKDQNGDLPLDFELSEEAQIVDSFFSPVLCATIVRITGPVTATPTELVTRVPQTATVTPHHRYLGAAEAEGNQRVVNGPATGRDPDPYRTLQYGLDLLGVERAWSITDGAGVTVALLDSAPQPNHPDLGTIRIEGLDDGAPARPAVHGTLMAGIIGAEAANGIGIAGLAPGADLVAIPVCQPSQDGAADTCGLYDLLRGIDRALATRARILNVSLVGPSNALLERAVARLEHLGVVVVAAAGNEGTEQPRYPAAYPSVIGVGASDSDGKRYSRSNIGLSTELLAPGVEVVSTTLNGHFALGDGTSLAAAHVSGVFALLLAAGADPVEARAVARGADDASADPAPVLRPICELLKELGRACP